MEAAGGTTAAPSPDQQQHGQAKAERLSSSVQQQLNLESIKTRSLGLYKAINRILDDFDAIARANATPRWQDVLTQFSMVNMELFNIAEDIKKVSKAFVVYPKNVNAVNAEILPVMLSSKLLPEMEADDNDKREQLLFGMPNAQIPAQLERIKARMDMIGAACEAAEKIISDARKNFGLGARQGPNLVPTLDKAQAAKIQEQENLLRSAVNFGEGLRVPADQRQLPSTLPSHLADVLTSGDTGQNFVDSTGIYQKSTPSSNTNNPQGVLIQVSGAQLIGRSVPSPSGIAGTTSFENASTPPLPYANSPRSSTNMMNTPSPQQQAQQQMSQQQQQQRQKFMQMSQQQQQILAQRQSSTPGMLGPNRQLQSASIQQGLAQNQMNQGNQLRSHLSQLAGAGGGGTLFNTSQASPNSQMIANMSATIQSQSLLPRMQFGLSGGHSQRSNPSQVLNDQMLGIGGGSPASMTAMQQHGTQGGFGGNMPGGSGGSTMNIPNFQQQHQRQPGQQ